MVVPPRVQIFITMAHLHLLFFSLLQKAITPLFKGVCLRCVSMVELKRRSGHGKEIFQVWEKNKLPFSKLMCITLFWICKNSSTSYQLFLFLLHLHVVILKWRLTWVRTDIMFVLRNTGFPIFFCTYSLLIFVDHGKYLCRDVSFLSGLAGLFSKNVHLYFVCVVISNTKINYGSEAYVRHTSHAWMLHVQFQRSLTAPLLH